jgi:hypothetical protein
MDDYRHIREIKQAAPYIAVYATFWGCTYLFGFWSTFNINPFQYISTSEIITHVVKVLYQPFIMVLFILLIEWLFFSKEEELDHTNELKDFRSRIIMVAVIAGVVLYFATSSEALYAAAISVIMTLVRPLSYADIFKSSFSSKPVRTAMAALTISIPLFSVLSAHTDAQNIINKKGSLNMIRRPSETCAKGCILIGKIGEYFSVRGANGKTIMLKTEEMKTFEIYEGTEKLLHKQ